MANGGICNYCEFRVGRTAGTSELLHAWDDGVPARWRLEESTTNQLTGDVTGGVTGGGNSRVASEAIRTAHTEAESTPGGVGVVKLMGRYAGFIAMHAAMANCDVDACLIPEVPPPPLLSRAKHGHY
eukprot:3420927-Pyramimonas_sp.AAC.1